MARLFWKLEKMSYGVTVSHARPSPYYFDLAKTSVETSVSITNERSVPLTSKLSSELTSFIDVANMITFFKIFFKFDIFQLVQIITAGIWGCCCLTSDCCLVSRCLFSAVVEQPLEE